jgi:DHA3 family tetracycline resistance protein-like MFS transporter
MLRRHTLNAFPIYLIIASLGGFALTFAQAVDAIYQVETIKMSAFQLILAGTALEVSYFLFQVPTGIVADLYSRRLSVIIGYIVFGIGYVVMGLAPRFELILLSSIILGAGYTFITGAEEAWVADEIGEERAGKAFLRGSQAGMAVSLLALPLSITLGKNLSLQLPILLGGGMLVALGLFLTLFMPERHFQPVKREERNSWQAMGRQIVEGGKAVRRSNMLLCIFGITLFVGLASEGFDRLDTAHFLQDITLPHLWGLASLDWFSVIGIGTTLLSIGANELINRKANISRPRVLIGLLFALNVLLIGSVALFALAGNFAVALLAYWCARVIRSVLVPLHSAWLTQSTEGLTRATVISFDGMVDPIGQIAGGPIVGLIGERFSIRAALVTTALLMSPVVIFFLRALGLSKPGERKEDSNDTMLEKEIVDEIVSTPEL